MLTNVEIAELLARRGDETDGPRQRAYRRSSAAAFVWPEEAADVHSSGRSLTELHFVGDRLAARIAGWIENPPDLPEAPPARRGFISRAEADRVLASAPGWRTGVKGDLQMHTTYSDGTATVAEMAEAASALGREYIAITDHSSGQRIPRGMDDSEMAAQAREIDMFNASRDTPRVLRSIEMNLYPDGSGALEEGQLEGMELVVGSFHSQLRAPENQTARFIAALRNPNVDILGHPRGRRYEMRSGLDADWPAVFDVAVEMDVALEINSNPARQDLHVELLELARDKNVRLSIGTDSHSTRELEWFVFAVASALKAGIDRNRILNFQPVESVLEWRGSRPRR
jgi:putative hydrolase